MAARGGSGEDPCPSQTLGCSGVPSQLRERGRLERFRRDKDKFPDSVLGRALDGWPGERWLDIRRIGVRAPIMKARIAKCARKGFDALEPDNIDGYQNKSVSRFPEATSFATTAGSRARRTRRASQLHSKNDLGQVKALVPTFEFAIVEECFRYRECGKAALFIDAGSRSSTSSTVGISARRPRPSASAR
jgi:hypothetical protein